MKLDDVLSISGLPGLYKLIVSRSNGLMVESYDTHKRQFISARKHQFTPLASIGIYTYTDVAPLDEVLKKVDSSVVDQPLPDINDKADVLRAWFKTIVADHDEDRVHINDIRKLIKWYTFLKQYAWSEITSAEEEGKGDSDEGNKE